MSTVAITGASGYIGQRLVTALDEDPAVKRVVGVDVVPPRLPSGKMQFVQMDVSDPSLAQLFRHEGVSALVHLAFVVQSIHDHRHMYDVNVLGTKHALWSAAGSTISQVLVLSSYTVYGAWPDHPASLDEDAPFRPNPGHAYGQHKVLVELLCDEFAAAHPEVAVVRLRPAIVVGPHCDNGLGRALRRVPFLPTFAGGASAMQFVHEDDLVTVCLAALRQRARGVYNIGAEGSLPWTEIVRRAGKSPITLPASGIEAAIGLLWKLRVPGLSSPGELSLIRHRLVVSSDNARRSLGWRPIHTTESALQSLAAA